MSEVLDQCRDFFVRYPSSKGETYGQHLIKNLSLACQKSLESTILLIHGIFPDFFQDVRTLALVCMDNYDSESRRVLQHILRDLHN